MFFSTDLLGKRTPLGMVWLAAHGKGFNRKQVLQVNIVDACDEILKPEVPHALRLQAILVDGVVCLFRQQSVLLLHDCHEMLRNMHKAIATSMLETTTPEPANTKRSKTAKRKRDITLANVDDPDIGYDALLGAAFANHDLQLPSDDMFVVSALPAASSQRHSSKLHSGAGQASDRSGLQQLQGLQEQAPLFMEDEMFEVGQGPFAPEEEAPFLFDEPPAPFDNPPIAHGQPNDAPEDHAAAVKRKSSLKRRHLALDNVMELDAGTVQAARHAINGTRMERAMQPVNVAPSMAHAVDAQVLAAMLFGKDMDEEVEQWLPYPAPALADPKPVTAQYGSYCPALADLYAAVAQQATPATKRRQASRRKDAAEEHAAPLSSPPPAYEDLPPLDDAPMLDDAPAFPDHAMAHYSPFTPAVGRPMTDDREVDLGGVVVHVEHLRAAVDGTPRPGMPAFLQPGFRGTSPMPLPSRTARPRRGSAADSHGLRTESETSTGPRRLGDADMAQLLDETHMLLPDLGLTGTEDFSMAVEVAGVTQTQLSGQHDSFGLFATVVRRNKEAGLEPTLQRITGQLDRQHAARAFFQLCVCTSVGLIKATQDVPYGDIVINLGAAAPAF